MPYSEKQGGMGTKKGSAQLVGMITTERGKNGTSEPPLATLRLVGEKGTQQGEGERKEPKGRDETTKNSPRKCQTRSKLDLGAAEPSREKI